MKIFIWVLTAACFFSACNADTEANKPASDSAANGTALIQDIDLSVQNPIGSFTGNFGDNKITMLISQVTADSIMGRSIVAGNDRPFTGTWKKDGNLLKMELREPGTDKHDGVFTINYDTKIPEYLQGQWAPFDESITGAKAFTLARRNFIYQSSVGEFPEASTRLLKEEDVENLGGEDLKQMRNEIFARHGYCFSRKEMRNTFEDKTWYVPHSTDIRNDLTENEKKNIKLILRYEKYAEEYGDDFGR